MWQHYKSMFQFYNVSISLLSWPRKLFLFDRCCFLPSFLRSLAPITSFHTLLGSFALVASGLWREGGGKAPSACQSDWQMPRKTHWRMEAFLSSKLQTLFDRPRSLLAWRRRTKSQGPFFLDGDFSRLFRFQFKWEKKNMWGKTVCKTAAS